MNSDETDSDVELLVEAIEDAFQIEFHVGELTDNSSLNDVCAAIRRRMPDRAPEACLTSIVFWRLRRACVELFGVSKRSIAPWTATDLILPSARRYQSWRGLSAAAGLKFPRLEYSSGFGHAIWWGSFVPTALLVIAGHGGWWIVVALALWITSANLLFGFLKPFADVLPTHVATFGDLAKTVVALNYGLLAHELGTSRDSEMHESVRYVIADMLGIDPRVLIGENARLIDFALANDGFRVQV